MDNVLSKLSSTRVTNISRVGLRRANIPPSYWTVRFKKITDPTTKTKIAKILFEVPKWVNASQGFIFRGTYHSGKTSLAVLIGMEVIRHGGVVTFVPTRSIMDIAYGKTTLAGEIIKDRIARSHLVIFDDLGTEPWAKNANGLLAMENILRDCDNVGSACVVTTNLNSTQLQEKYGSGIMQAINRVAKRGLTITNSEWDKRDKGSK